MALIPFIKNNFTIIKNIGILFEIIPGEFFEKYKTAIMNEMPVLLIDNKNPFCSKTMQLIFNKGGYNKFNFLSVHSDESKELLLKHGLDFERERLIVLFEKGKVFVNSGAFLHAVKELNGSLRWFYWFSIIPQKITEIIYDRISRRFSREVV
jgi:predicted DCC family thiol-disulfide oxidoreductase YuxK